MHILQIISSRRNDQICCPPLPFFCRRDPLEHAGRGARGGKRFVVGILVAASGLSHRCFSLSRYERASRAWTLHSHELILPRIFAQIRRGSVPTLGWHHPVTYGGSLNTMFSPLSLWDSGCILLTDQILCSRFSTRGSTLEQLTWKTVVVGYFHPSRPPCAAPREDRRWAAMSPITD